MSDEGKTKEQLLAELDALKKRLERLESAQPDAVTGKPAATEGGATPVLATPVTRRGAITNWVAPVILSVPAVQTASMLATVLKPGAAQAAITRRPTAVPTRAPTGAPTAAPTAAATAAPTSAPTAAGRCLPAPTAAPTVAPTLGMASAPDCRPNRVLVALGSARALSGSKLATRTASLSRSALPCVSLQA